MEDVNATTTSLLGAPAAPTKDLHMQGLTVPECGDKRKYATIHRTSAPNPTRGHGPPPPAGLLPPPRPEHVGKLTVVLDLDGTLVSTFTIKRKPNIPKHLSHILRSYVVGKGGPLNVDGVFVLERPGLREFLTSLAEVAEVVIFTAGLEDYARPILDAIDPEGTFFAARLYRPATVGSKYYQCVKDLSMLGRDLTKTVLVDYTPLAFLHQPHNGIPVFSFKGDAEDKVLTEAILPLIWTLGRQMDVRRPLKRRFQMGKWFSQNGFDLEEIGVDTSVPEPEDGNLKMRAGHLSRASSLSLATIQENRLPHHATKVAVTSTDGGGSGTRTTMITADDIVDSGDDDDDSGEDEATHGTAAALHPPPVLVCGFDQTLLDYDSVGRLIGLLAPDLLRTWM